MKHPLPPPLKNVPRETLARLEVYHDTLEKWRGHINLTGKSGDVWERHMGDSAQLMELLPSHQLSLADMGTGAGFPGMVLAIMGMRDVHLVESDTKKIVFLREIARLTNTPITIHHCRVEDLDEMKFDVITSRALAPLTQLFSYALPHLKPSSFCLFPKGKNYSIEIEEAQRNWRFDLEQRPSQSGDGVILIIRNLQRAGG